MSRETLTEVGTLTEATAGNPAKPGGFMVQLITPGWGSSGYYSAEVLQSAVEAKVWDAGTAMHLDHPTAAESEERPERSVKDLAAVLTEAATWNGEGVVAPATPAGLGKAFASDAEFLKAVGVSIRASAEVELGEAEGRSGWIVKEFIPDPFNTVDFVTHAGRGGRVLELIESARRTVEATVSDKAWSDFSQSDYDDAQWRRACLIDTGEGEEDSKARYKLPVKEPDGTLNRNGVHAAAGRLNQADVSADLKKAAAKKLVGLYRNQLDEEPPDALLTAAGMKKAAESTKRVAEATSNDIREALQVALVEAYGAEKTWLWIRDFDNDTKTVWFEVETTESTGCFAQSYTLDDTGAAALTGERIEVRVRTEYVPVNPAGETTTTEEQIMPQIEEARLRELEEAHGRVPTLEAERDTARTELESTKRELAVEKARVYAREFGTKRVREANSELPVAVVDKIVAEAMREIPLTDDEHMRLNTETFGTQIDEARKTEETYLASIVENGAGRVRGLGDSGEQQQVTESQLTDVIAGTFGLTRTGA